MHSGIPSALEPLGSGPAYKAKLARILAKTRMFGDFPAAEIEGLTDYVDLCTAKAGVAIIVEGGRAGFMGIVVEGRLEIFKDSGRGQSKLITELGPDSSVGEMSLVDGLPRSATTVAATPLTLIILAQEALYRLIKEQPTLGAKVLLRCAQSISQRLRKASAALVDYLD